MVGHLSQMAESLIRIAHSELVAYAGMILILTAFVLETRGILHSKERLYLVMMALGSGLLAVRAYLIDEWAFLILEVAYSIGRRSFAWLRSTPGEGEVPEEEKFDWGRNTYELLDDERPPKFLPSGLVHLLVRYGIISEAMETGAGYMVNSCQSGAFVRVLLGIGSFFKNIGHGISEQRHSLSLPMCYVLTRPCCA